MPVATAATQPQTPLGQLPTEESPQVGFACMFGVELSEAEYFVLDGDHVIRSREFDVIAGAPTFGRALERFNDEVLNFALYLSDLDDPAPNDEEMFHRLTPRLLRIMRAIEEQERAQRGRRRRFLGMTLTLTRDRAGDDDQPKWHPSSRHAGSSVPSLA